jgi:peroxiredoxin Q/BCP
MSKKTRKKTVATKTGKASRAISKKPAKKSAGNAARVSLAKSAGKPAKKPASKTATRKPAPGKSSKTSAKAPRAAPKAASKTPVAGRAGTTTPRTVVPSQEIAAPSATATLIEGGPAPKFDLPRDGGAQVRLADYSGQKLVIFFYPRADTPGCTREAMDFTRLSSDFEAAGTAVLGVSADPVKAQESFRNKHQLAVPLGSDETRGMLKAYGAWGEKSMYGKTFEGVLRTTVLVDESGRIARIWRGVRVDGHAEEVLAAARGG